MQFLKYALFILLTLCCLPNGFAQDTLKNSQQMVLVTTDNWTAVSGKLQRYSRESINKAWEKQGSELPVVVGKTGMAWGANSSARQVGVYKKEGDNKTPAGIFLIGPGFGFADKKPGKLDYFPLTPTSQCVDDPQSTYYGQLLDSEKVPNIDWHSAESMRQIGLYTIGTMVQYNTQHPVLGGGSCIFLHIWRNPTAGTAGCIAMEEKQLAELLSWLDSRKMPMLVLIPKTAYETVKKEWELPNL